MWNKRMLQLVNVIHQQRPDTIIHTRRIKDVMHTYIGWDSQSITRAKRRNNCKLLVYASCMTLSYNVLFTVPVVWVGCIKPIIVYLLSKLKPLFTWAFASNVLHRCSFADAQCYYSQISSDEKAPLIVSDKATWLSHVVVVNHFSCIKLVGIL